MAGFYPDVPAPRLAYDRDGTVGFVIDLSTNSVSQMSAGNLVTLNDESSGSILLINAGNSTMDYAYGLIFPELRNIIGVRNFHSGFGQTGGGSLQYTTNSSNGVDGTWTSIGATGYSDVTTGFSSTVLRTGITAISMLGVKGFRIRRNVGPNFGANSWYALTLHLYGSISAGQTPDRLRMWHPALDEPLDDNTSADGAYLDWGDVVRSTTQDRTFRVKNNSSTLTANSINIAASALTDAAPTLITQYTFSDGGAFGASVTVTSLSPGAISGVITVRRTTPSNAALSLWTLRITADPGSWT